MNSASRQNTRFIYTHTHINLLHYFTLNYEMLERESKNGILFQTESKKISFRNQTNGVLGQNQTYRSTEQNREPRNKPRNLHSISLQKRRLKATMEKRQSFQQVVLGKRDSLTLTNKVRTVHHTKNKPKMT